jgi:hypothetical protein
MGRPRIHPGPVVEVPVRGALPRTISELRGLDSIDAKERAMGGRESRRGSEMLRMELERLPLESCGRGALVMQMLSDGGLVSESGKECLAMGLSEGVESLRTLEEAQVGSEEISGVAAVGAMAFAMAAAQADEGTIEGELEEGGVEVEPEIEVGGKIYDKFEPGAGTTFTTVEIEGGEGALEGTEVEGEQVEGTIGGEITGEVEGRRSPEVGVEATDFRRSFCDTVRLWVT